MSSDSAPKQRPGLVERLRSRFEWGLMVDIQPPDLETKMAILDKKAESEGVELPDDVRVFIATKTQVQRARARGRPDQAGGVLVRDRAANQPDHGPADPEAPYDRARDRGSASKRSSARWRNSITCSRPVEAQEQRAAHRLPPPDRHVPCEGSDEVPHCPRSAARSAANTIPQFCTRCRKIEKLRAC